MTVVGERAPCRAQQQTGRVGEDGDHCWEVAGKGWELQVAAGTLLSFNFATAKIKVMFTKMAVANAVVLTVGKKIMTMG